MVKKRNAETGQGLVEYALLLAIVAGVVLAVLQLTGYSLRDAYCAAAKGLGAETACATARVYCEDDFANMDGWQTNWGRWTNTDGKLCTAGWAKNYNTCSQSMSNDEDYTINVTGAQLDRGNGYGVFFRGTNLDGRTNGYILQYDPGWRGGAIIMRKWINGRELRPFATKLMPGYDWFGEPHDIRLDVQGNTFTTYLDGDVILVGQDDTYASGGTGFRSWDGTQICFGSMNVTEIVATGGQ